jgi:flagellar motility protein MotE (MotC chaperone)
MNTILRSPGTLILLGGLLFFGTMFGLLSATHFGPAQAPDKMVVSAADDPSWKFHNPEMDQWIAQIKDERDALAVRAQQLKEWEAQLAAQGKELSTVTRAMSNVQADFDKRVVLFTEQEKENAKKQVKVVAGMSADGAATMFAEMPDRDVTKLLYSMKNELAGGILDAMSRQGPFQAKRAALLAQQMKDVMNAPPTNSANAYASH